MMKNDTNSTKESMSNYNGWTNYETWRIQLEVIDGMTPEMWTKIFGEDN